MNTYPIVKVKTEDNILLHGFLTEPTKSTDTIIIHIHGTAGNFFWDNYSYGLAHMAKSIGIAYIATNNRGTEVYNLETGSVPTGASLELFEDCIKDINAWIDFARDYKYNQIILMGHSFGTEKVVYYMNYGKYKNKVIGVILLGFADSVGTQLKYEKRIGKNYLKEASILMANGKKSQLLSDPYAMAGELPVSAQTYVNFFSPDSNLSKVLPFRNNELPMLRNINVPILGVISDNENAEYTIIPIEKACELIETENGNATTVQISGCRHEFGGKEEQLAKITRYFILDKL